MKPLPIDVLPNLSRIQKELEVMRNILRCVDITPDDLKILMRSVTRCKDPLFGIERDLNK